MYMPDYLQLSSEGAEQLAKLRKLANFYNVLCQQAPMIWDAENPEDAQLAKSGCNGTPHSSTSTAQPPCPIRKLCLQTAIATKSNFGVWGGLTASERRNLKRIR